MFYDNDLMEIKEFNGTYSIHETAMMCRNGADIFQCWRSLLSRILNNWEADVEIDLDEAVAICMSVSKVHEVSKKWADVNFWYQDHTPTRSRWIFWHRKKFDYREMKIYRITVALFVSINYWCWHDSPVSIRFDEKGLINCLQYPIHIEWEEYDRLLIRNE